jgi:ribose transport system substrate-binding protein
VSHIAPALREQRRRSCVRTTGPRVLAALLALLALLFPGPPATAQRTYRIAFANLTEEPGVTLESTGFTGREVRESFALAARLSPVEMVFYDNQRDDVRAVANAEAAVKAGVELYVQYHRGAAGNARVAEILRAAKIPVLAINHPVPGAALYTIDNAAAGRVAGEALADFVARSWRGQPITAAVVGPLAGGEGVAERARGAAEVLTRRLPAVRVSNLDTQGNPMQVATLLGKLLAAHPSGRVIVVATDDATALATKGALEAAGRLADGAIVSHGVDRSIHGGINDRKEIDPNNRGSIVIGSVAFYLDRLGYDVLPLALKMLGGEPVPPRTTVRHKLITPANVFVEYPPYDMN